MHLSFWIQKLMSDDQHLLSPFTPRDVTAYEAKSVVAETPADVEAEMADAVIRGEATKHYVSVSARW